MPNLSKCCGAEVRKTGDSNLYSGRYVCEECHKWCYILEEKPPAPEKVNKETKQ